MHTSTLFFQVNNAIDSGSTDELPQTPAFLCKTVLSFRTGLHPPALQVLSVSQQQHLVLPNFSNYFSETISAGDKDLREF